ncbi:ribosomal protein l17 [Nannochloropsis gaditana]|uniref:Large ribosomal subunit protein bL17c n=1 Tax=Nannochloropsis gaditana TaxID=72520 RepID=W7U3L1_9STRA|nr:ribosomal protein l17 [Nannochloropsis gaditana]
MPYRKLGRTSSHRWAMLRNMVTSLVEHERIRTTTAKAKELRRVADRMVTWAKDGSLHARRQAAMVIRTKEHLKKLFDVLGPRYLTRAGGYTRVLKLQRFRPGDAAEMSLIEFVGRPGELRPARPPQTEIKLSSSGKAMGKEDVISSVPPRSSSASLS